MEINIRRLTTIDAAELSVMAAQTFYDTFVDTCTAEDMKLFLDKFYNEEQLRQELSDEEGYCFFAEQDGKPLAYLYFKEEYSSFPMMQKWKALELKRIYVLKEFHGQGIAQKLMDYIINYAIENKYEVIWLGVWEHNIRAQKFYAKYGFENSGHTHDFPIGNTPQTDVWLWKFL